MELVKGSVPPSSVLMMTIAPGRVPSLASFGKRGDAQRRRSKSHTALERARGLIKEVYPEGVPGQAAEPNANLCRRVGEKLKHAGLPHVSDDTILRAAGRRK